MDGQAGKNRATDEAGHGATEVDARGLRCPIPALRLARAVREGGSGRYRLLADDPAAEADIPALCSERSWTLLEVAPGAFLVAA
jgi:tRNA 2-thiouridine synthesizing protein A